MPDPQQLDFATSRGRTVFTFNTRDFVKLHREYLAERCQQSGIIVPDQIHVGLIARRLLKLIDGRSVTDMQNWLEFLSNWRKILKSLQFTHVHDTIR